jgi:WD40 repeat protein
LELPGEIMGTLFISHSSRNDERAVRVRDWLRENGWNDVFLDLDPVAGLAPGQRWQDELKAAGERCAAVVVLVSPDWVASRWCQTEFLVAVQLGKKIFGILIEKTPFAELPLELAAHFQLADVSTPELEEDGFARLRLGLVRAGLHPRDFPWPPPHQPHRSPYRGLGSLEEQDAAIFFGRDASITKGLDALRRLRDGAPERCLVILGASGAGKSSFLKAGLLARLGRDEENFLVLPTFRPERAALGGPRGLLKSLGLAAVPPDAELPAALAAQRAPVLARLERRAAAAGEKPAARPPTLVLPVDQAEEIFAADNGEGPAALELLRSLFAADRQLVAILTLRSDSFGLLQAEPRLAEVPRLPFDLPRLSPAAFEQVIEGPAGLVKPPIEVERELTERLGQDLDTADALPLLAFTLERLFADYGREGKLGLGDYLEGLGGIAGAIEKAAGDALAAARRDPELPKEPGEIEALARRAFIPWLVRIDELDAPPKRRVALRGELPAESLPLVRHLVDRRLLVEDRRGGETTVEVSHEAVLRHWKALGGWIAEDREDLRALEAVLAAAQDWRREGQEAAECGESWLTHRGDRLAAAERLLRREDYASRLGEAGRTYLAASRSREDAERERQREQDERERRQLLRQRSLQRRAIALVSALAIAAVIFAAVAVSGSRAANRKVSLVLADAAQKATAAGYYGRAARLAILAAHQGFLSSTDEAAVPSLVAAGYRSRLLFEVPAHEGSINGFTESADGTLWLTWDADGHVRLWEAADGKARVEWKHQGQAVAAFSPDGKSVLSLGDDGVVSVRSCADGGELARVQHGGAVAGASFSPDGGRILSWEDEGSLRVSSASSGERVAAFSREEILYEAGFSPDGSRILILGDEGAASWGPVAGAAPIRLGAENAAEGAFFSADGSRIHTWDFGGIATFDAASGAALSRWPAPRKLKGVVASPDRSRLFGFYTGGGGVWWTPGGAREIPSPGFEADGATIAGGGDELLWWTDDGEWQLERFPRPPKISGGIEGASFAADGRRLLLSSSDGTITTVDLQTGVIDSWREESTLRGASFTLDASRIVVWSDSGALRVFGAVFPAEILLPADSGRDLARLETQGEELGVAFSPDGGRKLVWTKERWDLLDAATGKPVGGKASTAWLAGARFSPAGEHVLIWDMVGGLQIFTADASTIEVGKMQHFDAVQGARFSPEGRRLLSWDSASLRIWDPQTGIELARRDLAARVADFTADGKGVLLIEQGGGSVRQWDVGFTAPRRDTAALVAEVCASKLRGPDAFGRSVRRITPEDAEAAPLLRGRVGEDVCAEY